MLLRIKFLLIFIFFAVVPLMLAGALAYQKSKEILIEETSQKLVAVADVQKKRLNERLERYFDQVRSVASQAQLRLLVAEYEKTTTPEVVQNIHTILQDIKKSTLLLDTVSIRDLSGVTIASTDSDAIGKADELTQYVRGVQNFELNDIFKNKDNLLRIRLFGPILSSNQNIGFVEIVMSADDLVAITEDYAGLGATGEITIAKKNQAGDALFLTPLRFDSGAALSRAISRETINSPIVRSLAGKEEVVIGEDIIDYRGEHIFAVIRFIDSLGWGLVVKIDTSEALAPANALLSAFIIIMIITVLIAGMSSYFLSSVVTIPIIKLAAFADEVANKNFTTTTTTTTATTRKDELGMLSRAFNTMVVKLRESYSSLEQKVHDRTKELYEAKAKDEAILASIGDGIAVADETGKLIYLNKNAEIILGSGTDNNLPDTWQEKYGVFDASTGEPLPTQKMPLLLAVRGKVVTKVPLIIRNANSPEGRVIAVTANPILLDGKSIGGIAIFRDMTKENEIDKAKTELVSLASHQLRTPLTAISWYAEMLLTGDGGKISSEQKKYITEIYDGNQRMIELVNALLNVSRFDLGTFSAELMPTNISLLAQSVVQELKPDIVQKKLDVQEHYANDVPIMQVDPKLMQIVFQNLLSNSVKYTPVGGLVTLSIVRDKKNVTISVTDTGYGIQKNQQDKIFTKLFRADNIQDKDTTGTGLGLYLVKSILDHGGGKIWFESVENKGTTFYVEIPLAGMKHKMGTRRIE